MTVHHRRKLRVSSMLIFFDRPSVPNEKEINHGMVSWQTITITLLGVNNGTSKGMRVRAYYRQSEMFFSTPIVRAVALTIVVAAVNQYQ
jgi:hypothetical protein